MAKTGFSIDTKDFDIKFPDVGNRQIPQAAAFSFYKVASMVIADAILEEPRAPHKTSNLWRSQLIEAPHIKLGEISIELGFNAEYAAVVHEMGLDESGKPIKSIDWTMEGSGAKFLEAKLIKNKEKYMAELARGMQGPK